MCVYVGNADDAVGLVLVLCGFAIGGLLDFVEFGALRYPFLFNFTCFTFACAPTAAYPPWKASRETSSTFGF